MKKILFLILLTVGLNAQVTSIVRNDLTKQGSGIDPTGWRQNVIFSDSGDTRIGPLALSEPPIGLVISRNKVWSLSDTTYTYDSSFTACNLSFLLGFDRYSKEFPDSIATTDTTYNVITRIAKEDTLDFMPLYDDGSRVVIAADSLQWIKFNPADFAGAKYMYIEFRDSTADTLLPQGAARTFYPIYRKY